MNRSARNLFGATLEAERLRNARGLLTLRAALTVAALGVTLLAFASDVRGARARLPILGVYCALSLCLFAIGRKRLEILRHSWVAIALLDVPAVFAFQRAAMLEVPEYAPLVAGVTVGIYLLLVTAVPPSIRRIYLVPTGGTQHSPPLVPFAPPRPPPTGSGPPALLVAPP